MDNDLLSVEELNKLNTLNTPAPTSEDIAFAELQKSANLLSQEVGEEAQVRAQKEAEADIAGLSGEVTKIAAKSSALQKDAAAIPLLTQEEFREGRGVSASGVQLINTQKTRLNTISQLQNSAAFDVAKGNLEVAMSKIDQAIALEFEPKKAELEDKQEQIKAFLPYFTEREKTRAEELKRQYELEDRKLDEEKEIKKTIQTFAIEASANGAPKSVVDQILAQTSIDEALKLGLGFTSPEKQLDLQLKKLELATKQKEYEVLQKYEGLSPAEYRAMLRDEQKAVDEAETEADKNDAIGESIGSKIVLLDNILTNPGMKIAVGPTAFSRISGIYSGGLAPASMSGAVDRFIGQTEQMISKEFLDSLVSAKSKGATFGALTKPEQDALTAAATYIGQRRVYDGKGDDKTVVAYDMSESDFKKEIETIRDSARKVYERTTGNILTSEEDQQLGQFFGDGILQADAYFE